MSVEDFDKRFPKGSRYLSDIRADLKDVSQKAADLIEEVSVRLDAPYEVEVWEMFLRHYGLNEFSPESAIEEAIRTFIDRQGYGRILK